MSPPHLVIGLFSNMFTYLVFSPWLVWLFKPMFYFIASVPHNSEEPCRESICFTEHCALYLFGCGFSNWCLFFFLIKVYSFLTLPAYVLTPISCHDDDFWIAYNKQHTLHHSVLHTYILKVQKVYPWEYQPSNKERYWLVSFFPLKCRDGMHRATLYSYILML